MNLLDNWMRDHLTSERSLFTAQDVRSLYPHLSDGAFKTLLSRHAMRGSVKRVCRGVYLDSRFEASGFVLFHTAALLRANDFVYLSLETVLSEEGMMSQQPLGWITLVTSGRSSIIKCGAFGSIEFVHTKRSPSSVHPHLHYDNRYRLWRADAALALDDLKRCGRGSLDLVEGRNV